MDARWKHRPEHSNWGEFGPDDEVGRLNLITPERRLSAISEVREGRTFCLSLPLDLPGGSHLEPWRRPPVRQIVTRERNHPWVNFPMSFENPRWDDIGSDDYVILHPQYSTQWDSLCHVGRYFDADGDGQAEPVYYNGFRAGIDILGPDDSGGPAAAHLGVERMAETCIQGRGVLVDLHAHFGSERKLISVDELSRVLDADRVVVQTGDILCLHTGYGQAVVDMAGDPDPAVLRGSYSVLDGRDDRLLDWIEDSGVAAIVGDNFAIEGFPYPDRVDAPRYHGLPLHQRCLVDLGIPIGELWFLTQLAQYLREARRSRFLLTAPPLRLTGSFGSPVTPVATV